MTVPGDRPTIPERYARALESSHLEATPERQGDVDVLIAAGWAKDSLGTALYRLRAEYDAVNKRELALVANSRIARAIVMSQLQSLQPTKLRLTAYALKQATINRVMLNDTDVMRIAAAALAHWIDDRCPACTGRGFSGGAGQPIVLCSLCRGTGTQRLSGSRSKRLGQNNTEHQFGALLLERMDRKTAWVASTMARWLRRFA